MERASRPEACVLGLGSPARRLIEIVGSKWALLCLYALDDGPVRFNALERRLVGVTQKMLSETLRKLERAGLVERHVFAEIPPRVEYQLTPLGMSLKPITASICAWSQQHAGKLVLDV
ncbi:MAG: transcriptional regulator [Methylobacterium sp.]|nr:MAG: transcriptional regulator [Methylobacterium sp.]